jgi:ribonuclease VapC
MVLDTSAILAILQDEPERRRFNEAIEAAETRSLSTASFVECSMTPESRYGADGVRDRRSAALNWEGVVPSHVRKAR